MDITLIVLVIFFFIALAFLLLFLFKSINKNSFVSDDGTIFDNQSALDSYQIIYEKTKPMFLSDDQKNTNIQILGFETSFLTKLTNEGFSDFKTLYKYRKQIKNLSDLINT